MRSLAILLILASASLQAQSAKDIINRYLDTVSNGSLENWKKIRSAYTETESYYSQQDYEQKVNFLKKPDKPTFNKSYNSYRL